MVKFKVTSRPIGGEDTSYVETKLRTDTAKFTNMRIAGFTQSIIALIRKTEEFIKYKARIASRDVFSEKLYILASLCKSCENKLVYGRAGCQETGS